MRTSTLWRDSRFGLRLLKQNAGFTAIALLTLALSVGANTALFSLIRAVLLRPLPYPQADRIVALWERNAQQGFDQELVTPGDFADLRAASHSFSALGFSPAWPGGRLVNLVGPQGTERIPGAWVSAGYFDVLGVRPALGRTFLPREDSPSAAPAAVLSYDLWQNRFAGRRDILGQPVTVDSFHRVAFTVVGIMPPDFQFPEQTRVWLSAGQMGVTVPAPGSAYRGGPWFEVIGRLAPGQSPEHGQVELSSIARRLAAERPRERIGSEVKVVGLHRQLVGPSGTALLLLFGAVGLVLLVACANMAGLLLARASARRKEFTVRAAIGASRADLVRQVLAENLLVAALGGSAGLLLSFWLLDLLKRLLSESIPLVAQASLDPGVLAFAALLTLGSGILFGCLPALTAGRVDLNPSLLDSRSAGSSRRQRRFRDALVVAEIAVAVVLVACTALFTRSLLRLQQVDPGFRPEGVAVVSLDMSSSTYSDDPKHTPQQFFGQLLDRVSSLPRVHSVAGTSFLPLESGGFQDRPGNGWSNQVFVIERRPPPPNPASLVADPRVITPRYFETLRVPLQAGRAFLESDGPSSPKVAVINQAMARRFWPAGDALGARFRFNRNPDRPEWWTIVGIVSDIRSARLDGPARPEFYLPYTQAAWHDAELVVRSAGGADPAQLAAAIRAEVQALDRNVPVTRVRTLDDVVQQRTLQPRFRAGLFSAFAFLALFLAALGVYGVLAQAVAQRTREIGVRLALGGSPRSVFQSILASGLRTTFLGLTLGLLGTAALTRVLSGLLFGVPPYDPVVLGITVAVLSLVGALASLLPACRAARIDPVLALKYE